MFVLLLIVVEYALVVFFVHRIIYLLVIWVMVIDEDEVVFAVICFNILFYVYIFIIIAII